MSSTGEAEPPLPALAVRHLISQRKVVTALAGVVADSLLRAGGGSRRSSSELPGPELVEELAPPSERLVRDYLRHVGADVRAHRGTIPPHLFPHWSFPLAARSLLGLPYRLLSAVNGGCRLVLRAPLALNQPLRVRARLVAIKDDGRRAVLQQRVVTGQAGCELALAADLYVIVPSAAGRGSPARGERPVRDRPSVPEGASELSRLQLSSNAGLAYAILTGDFNPIHWLGAYARAAGFQGPLLHGFALLARVIEALQARRFGGSSDRLESIDVRFASPLYLPSEVGLYVTGHELFVGRAAGEPAYLTASFQEKLRR
jgi:acyl dehydratase